MAGCCLLMPPYCAIGFHALTPSLESFRHAVAACRRELLHIRRQPAACFTPSLCSRLRFARRHAEFVYATQGPVIVSCFTLRAGIDADAPLSCPFFHMASMAAELALFFEVWFTERKSFS